MLQQHKTDNGSSLTNEKNLKEKSRGMIDQAQDWYHTAENVVSKVASQSTDVTKKYPLQSLAMAFGAGFILSRIFRRVV